MKDATLALVELAHHEDICADLGVTSQEVFLNEFADRVRRLKRAQDEVIQVLPHKLCLWMRNVRDTQLIELAAAKLQRLFEEPIRVVDKEIKARCHAAFVPPIQSAPDVADRLKLAEQGLREARSRQIPFVIKDTPAPSRVEDGLKRIREIELAMQQGEFVLYFQPKVHAGYRSVTGAEALMRWHRPEQGVVPPSEFIAHAHRGGLLPDLTWFAVKSAISSCRRWPSSVGVAVNVPPTVLVDGQLCDVVRDALAIFSVNPERLTLEVTEEAMIEQPDRTMAIMRELRSLGIRLAIDDFGTGYSSLAYLRDLPVDELKIDRSFVQFMTTQPQNIGLVKGIIELAHNLDLKVVAEGVEDEATADTLENMGCDLLQGFCFGKPVRADQFAARLMSR